MAYTKYSLTPANNNAAPPDGAPEGMLPSAVNDTMRDMMAQIRDVGDGIRDGTYPFGAGTASAPSISTTGDSNTGIFFPAADTIAFTEGGVEAMRIDSAGNVGIGVTPSAWYTSFGTKAIQVSGSGALYGLDVSSSDRRVGLFNNAFINSAGANIYINTGAATQYQQVAGTHTFSTAPSGTAGNAITFTERMRIDSAGNVGIGVTPSAWSSSFKAIQFGASSSIYNNNAGDTFIGANYYNDTSGDNRYLTTTFAAAYGQVDGTHQFFTAPSGTAGNTVTFTERMRIDTDGNVLIGRSSYSSSQRCIQIEFTGQINVGSNTTSAYNRIVFQNPNGTVGTIVTTGSSTAYNTSSDYRLKENIAPMTGALDRVAQLKPVTYNWKVDGSEGEGFIAHELQEVVPECVTGEKDGMQTEKYEISPAVPATYDEEGNELTPAVEAVIGEREVPAYQGIDTSFLVATLTAAIQEQQTMIEELKAKVAALEAA